MTYRELLEKLSMLSDDQLDNMDVTIYDSLEDEYFPGFFEIVDECGVLDNNHPVLVL